MAYDIKYHCIFKCRKVKESDDMTLKEGRSGESYILEKLCLGGNLERRLWALGLTPGTVIRLLNNDKKGAVTVGFRGTRFAFGKKIACRLLVREVGA